MYNRALIKRMTSEERNLVRDGGFIVGFLTGMLSYHNYRQHIKKDFLRSEGHYRMSIREQNITPWKQLYFTWWRMPEEEFTVFHRFKPYFILGQLDYSKEILIPRTRFIHG